MLKKGKYIGCFDKKLILRIVFVLLIGSLSLLNSKQSLAKTGLSETNATSVMDLLNTKNELKLENHFFVAPVAGSVTIHYVNESGEDLGQGNQLGVHAGQAGDKFTLTAETTLQIGSQRYNLTGVRQGTLNGMSLENTSDIVLASSGTNIYYVYLDSSVPQGNIKLNYVDQNGAKLKGSTELFGRLGAHLDFRNNHAYTMTVNGHTYHYKEARMNIDEENKLVTADPMYEEQTKNLFYIFQGETAEPFTVKYLGPNNQELRPTETVTGRIGDFFNVDPVMLLTDNQGIKYHFAAVTLDDQAVTVGEQIDFDSETHTIIYHYENEPGVINVHYIDDLGNDLGQGEQLGSHEGKVNDSFYINAESALYIGDKQYNLTEIRKDSSMGSTMENNSNTPFEPGTRDLYYVYLDNDIAQGYIELNYIDPYGNRLKGTTSLMGRLGNQLDLAGNHADTMEFNGHTYKYKEARMDYYGENTLVTENPTYQEGEQFLFYVFEGEPAGPFTVKYLGPDNQEIKPTETVSGKFGDQFHIDPEQQLTDAQGIKYDFSQVYVDDEEYSVGANVPFDEQSHTVTYRYQTVPSKINIHYVDDEGNEIGQGIQLGSHTGNPTEPFFMNAEFEVVADGRKYGLHDIRFGSFTGPSMENYKSIYFSNEDQDIYFVYLDEAIPHGTIELTYIDQNYYKFKDGTTTRIGRLGEEIDYESIHSNVMHLDGRTYLYKEARMNIFDENQLITGNPKFSTESQDIFFIFQSEPVGSLNIQYVGPDGNMLKPSDIISGGYGDSYDDIAKQIIAQDGLSYRLNQITVDGEDYNINNPLIFDGPPHMVVCRYVLD